MAPVLKLKVDPGCLSPFQQKLPERCSLTCSVRFFQVQIIGIVTPFYTSESARKAPEILTWVCLRSICSLKSKFFLFLALRNPGG